LIQFDLAKNVDAELQVLRHPVAVHAEGHGVRCACAIRASRLHLGMHGNGDDPIEDFPLGDGTADTTASVVCPYCGEENEIAVDPGSGDSQEYIEDCQVCCRPWRVMVGYDAAGGVHVHLDPADDP
jgi:cysteine-rich CPXCG protein